MALKVLIVDDAGFIRHILGSLLEDMGCMVIGEARSGPEAIVRAKSLKPDVIFMDMVLPGQNGAEAAAEILEESPEMCIVAMSTATEGIVRERALLSGCRDFMEKPFHRESLQLLLNKLMSDFASAQQDVS